MKRYKASKKGLIHYTLLISFVLPIALFFLENQTFMTKPLMSLLLFSPFLFILWVYLDTYYIIDDQYFIYRSAFLKGKVDIQSIKEIQTGKTLWSGVKPALAPKGLIIKYNRYDEIYVAPENNEELIEDFLKLNRKIKVQDVCK